MYVQEFGFWFYSDQCKCRVLDVTARVVVTGGKFLLISTTPKVHVPPVSYICEFTKKTETTLMG
jgi:hypothetical protein